MNGLNELILATILEDVVARFFVRDVNTNIRQHLPSPQASLFRAANAFPVVVRTNSNESERYSSRLRHRNALTENRLAREREQREQSIYHLFWYLSANVALGIYFKNSLETK